MAQNQSAEVLRRPARVLWVVFPIIAVLSLLLGYLGLYQSVPDRSHEPLDLIYHDLQLFVLGSDLLQDPDRMPLALNIARFSAPAVTLYALVEACRRLLAVEVSRIRARQASGHALVCGDTDFAAALTRRLQSRGVKVVEVRSDRDEFVTAGEPLRIVGDARDPQILLAAGIDHASTVYACAGTAATNIAIALAVERTVASEGDPVRLYAAVYDQDFCATIQAFFLGREPSERTRLDFFNIDQLSARRLIADDPVRPVRDGPPSVLIAGTDSFAQACLVEAARSWRVQAPDSGRLPVAVIGPRAYRILNGLTQRYPFVAEICTLQTHDSDLLRLIRSGELHDPPDRVLITDPDEEYALMTAMAAERYWGGRSGPITVRLDGAMVGGPGATGRPDVSAGNLRFFGAVAAASDPELIGNDLSERLARVLHDLYLRGRLAREARPEPNEQALRAWEDLPDRLRQANREQAEDISHKLRQMGLAIAPRYTAQPEARLSETELDALAQMEHRRWRRQRQAAGWRYAPHRDEDRKLHPALVDWNQLPHNLRERNYDPIRDLPQILGEAGLQIVHG